MGLPRVTASARWPTVSYDGWPATCDTLHAHTQVLGKLAAQLAPPEPEPQHTALRLTARGWETAALPAPDGSGALMVALDLRAHQAVVEHTGGWTERIPLTPHRAVGDVTREVLAAVRRLGGPVEINPVPQEVPWTVALDEDDEHAHYDPEQVRDYFIAATRAAQVLTEFRAPFRGRSTPVAAWWGAFDLGVSLFSGRPALPPSDDFIMRNSADAEQLAVGWWPGDVRYPNAAFYAFLLPAPEGWSHAAVAPAAAHWNRDLGSSSWTGTTCGPHPMPTPTRCSSLARCSARPARSAGRTRCSPAASTGGRRRCDEPRGAGPPASPARPWPGPRAAACGNGCRASPRPCAGATRRCAG